MTLEEVADRLDSLDRETIICALTPWTPSSECLLTPPDANLAVPAAVMASGFEYLLEVHIALEVLEVFDLRKRKPTNEERARLLIHYAIEDAYPDWVYDRE